MKIFFQLFVITLIVLVQVSSNFLEKVKIKDFSKIVYKKRYLNEPSDSISSTSITSDTISSTSISSDTISSSTIPSTSISSTTISSTTISSTTISSDTIKTTPSANYTNNPDKILIGYDNYTSSSGNIHFFAYVRYLSGDPDQYIDIVLKINRNLRVLEEISETVTCPCLTVNDSIAKYSCSKKVDGNISKVEVDDEKTDIKQTELAEKMGDNLENQVGDIISDKGMIVLEKCKINSINDMITCRIKTFPTPSINNKDVYFHIVQKGKVMEIPATIIQDNEVQILLKNIKYPINANINGALGTIDDDKNILLNFDEGEDSTLNYSPILMESKKKGGLSTGGIVAIIIPCILVLLGVAALTFFLQRRNPVPLKENIANISNGVNSSSNIINK